MEYDVSITISLNEKQITLMLSLLWFQTRKTCLKHIKQKQHKWHKSCFLWIKLYSKQKKLVILPSSPIFLMHFYTWPERKTAFWMTMWTCYQQITVISHISFLLVILTTSLSIKSMQLLASLSKVKGAITRYLHYVTNGISYTSPWRVRE